MTTINFSAGPGALPKSVLKQIQSELFSYKNSGASVMELSHRSSEIIELIEETVEGFKRLLELDDDWEVMLLQGGGTLQFSMVPLNLSREGDLIEYADTGYWSKKAINEAKLCKRKVSVVGFGSDIDTSLPVIDSACTSGSARYLHLCSNNTVEGTQFRDFPDIGTPLVLDVSSDMLSYRMNLDNVSCIYAHAQKNIGLSGLTVVAVRKKYILENNDIPQLLQYRSHIESKSNYHTPPVFSIYVANLMQKWLENEIGGVAAMEEINNQKAKLLYDSIDASNMFRCPVGVNYRSKMNIVFTTGHEETDDKFVAFCKERNIIGVAGHRSQKRLRASLYNAVTIEDVKALTEVISLFEKQAYVYSSHAQFK
ncbi:3-phosphoserine/phosphohydroxythreonine transaminase [Paenibacillus contaminans]|uniref:Phosphoserine aminotransferase n=1 Tax=Paenibacillus contaminans TaxID=450362 RepID=A0A329MPT0_9BACL|nr:3-phosphoserine/phosphohydroxythreonine transaminase [Paenibacillus contaminans]RAV21478.1 3-phosphoserine/phosphohydroxythreonine transaminase [Paenibacillus contaminans]